MTYEYKHNWTLGENKPNSNPIKPNQTQFGERIKLMQSVYLQRIMKKNADMSYEKTKPKQTQFKPCPERSRMGQSNPIQADKIALKIYPFGIDCPIGLKEKLFSIYRKDYD